MKAKVFISQLTEFEIDNWDFEGNKYDIPEDLNEFGLIDFEANNFEQEELKSFNDVLHTLQVRSIDQFYYGGGAIRPDKDKKLHLEITIEYNEEYNEEDLNWVANELMFDLKSESPGVHGVYIKLIGKAIIEKVEEVK